MSQSRRHFIAGMGALAAGLALPLDRLSSPSGTLIYQPVDLSFFERPITPAPGQIRFGYAAITWGGNDAQAIEDISQIGFRGIQLRANILRDYGERPRALRELLDRHQLEMVALSSGGVGVAAGTETDEIEKHLRNARFVHDVGGRYLQVTDAARPKDRPPAASDFKELGRRLTEIGKRTMDLGVPLGYHNHMGSLGQAPDEVHRILEAVDSRYVKLELDIAHYQAGGGDPARAVRQYRDRLLFLHVKDVEMVAPGMTADSRHRGYRFVELGRGKIDLPAFFAALKEVGFRGWAVVELDNVTDSSITPKESALICKKYLEDQLGFKI